MPQASPWATVTPQMLGIRPPAQILCHIQKSTFRLMDDHMFAFSIKIEYSWLNPAQRFLGFVFFISKSYVLDFAIKWYLFILSWIHYTLKAFGWTNRLHNYASCLGATRFSSMLSAVQGMMPRSPWESPFVVHVLEVKDLLLILHLPALAPCWAHSVKFLQSYISAVVESSWNKMKGASTRLGCEVALASRAWSPVGEAWTQWPQSPGPWRKAVGGTQQLRADLVQEMGRTGAGGEGVTVSQGSSRTHSWTALVCSGKEHLLLR